MIDYLKDRIAGKAPKGAKRSAEWPTTRGQHLFENPLCSVCGGKKKIQVHHIIPFHIAPDLELEPKNLITLCERKKYGINCHLLIGHLGNYRRTNAVVKADAAYWQMKLSRF